MRRALVSAAVCVFFPASHGLSAQEDTHRLALTARVLVFEGVRGEAGMGLGAAVRYTPGRIFSYPLAFEAGFQALSVIDQTCTLSVPGGCSPIGPASPIVHARVVSRTPSMSFIPIRLMLGLGGYGPIGRADDPSALALGLEAGVEIRLSNRASVEVSYVDLRTSRSIGWALPLNLVLRL